MLSNTHISKYIHIKHAIQVHLVDLPLDHVDQMMRNVSIAWVSGGHVFILLTVKATKDLVLWFIGE